MICFLQNEELEKKPSLDRGKAIDRIVDQAVKENYDDMADDEPKKFFDFLSSKMAEYFHKVIAPIAEDFALSLKKKYEGQLAFYRYAIGKSFGVSDVRTELIDLYR